MNQPRVLVLSANPFTRQSNNGLTMTTFFEGWPAARIAQIYVPSATPIVPEFEVCSDIRALGVWGLRRVQEAQPWRAGAVGVRQWFDRSIGARREFRWLVHPIREAWLSTAFHGVRHEALMADGHPPEVVFSTLGTLNLVEGALAIARHFHIPIVPFITDDWPSTEYARVAFSAIMRRRLLSGLQRILREAPVRFVASEAMAHEYASRYGGEFRVVSQGIDPARFAVGDPPNGPRVILTYAGQLGIRRWEGLREIGRALRALSEEGYPATLCVYSNSQHVREFGARIHDPPFVEVRGTAPHDAMPAIYGSSDVLVHVESFDESLARYTRLSFSTKLGECLMAGRPLFARGPLKLSSIDYVRRSGAGRVVAEEGQPALRQGLRELLADPAVRARLGANARAVALERHASSRIQATIRDGLREATRARSSGD